MTVSDGEATKGETGAPTFWSLHTSALLRGAHTALGRYLERTWDVHGYAAVRGSNTKSLKRWWTH